MRIQTKRILQVALASGGLLAVGSGVASAESIVPGVSDAVLGQLATNPGIHHFANTVNGAPEQLQAVTETTGEDLQQSDQPLAAALPAVQQPVVGSLAPVLHVVPLHLLQQDVAPSTEADGDSPEHDLNAPLGSELSATDLPALPAALPLAATADTEQGRATITPVDDRLPLHGNVSTEPLDPEAGTRVTGLQASADAAAPLQQTDERSATGLPLVGGLVPSTGGLPTLNGLPDVTQLLSLGGLTQLAGNTPLTQGGLTDALKRG
ncbi:hypothetical protein [Amycolatopsis sp. Hca4]|uniref:hypothetical protein n=1 Tax=Amycolatopsis sp. Hca4 TaxID=2742131 RepID=UPI0015922BB4|nr:hypothetical protein [Amycolatopsis sp. Hca4]QKV76808.1 hypothetical protein HUT10_25775 [Amycolatopsis sp. Hca4]